MAAELQPLIDKVWRHCEDKGSRGRTVMLQVKFNDFEIITRSRSVPVAVSSRSNLELPVNCPAPERDAAFQTGVPLGNLAMSAAKATSKTNCNSACLSNPAQLPAYVQFWVHDELRTVARALWNVSGLF